MAPSERVPVILDEEDLQAALTAAALPEDADWYVAKRAEAMGVTAGVTRRVRTPEGAKHYGQPIGAVITKDMIRRKGLLRNGSDSDPDPAPKTLKESSANEVKARRSKYRKINPNAQVEGKPEKDNRSTDEIIADRQRLRKEKMAAIKAEREKDWPVGTKVEYTKHSIGGKSEQVQGEVVGHDHGIHVKSEAFGTEVVEADNASHGLKRTDPKYSALKKGESRGSGKTVESAKVEGKSKDYWEGYKPEMETWEIPDTPGFERWVQELDQHLADEYETDRGEYDPEDIYDSYRERINPEDVFSHLDPVAAERERVAKAVAAEIGEEEYTANEDAIENWFDNNEMAFDDPPLSDDQVETLTERLLGEAGIELSSESGGSPKGDSPAEGKVEGKTPKTPEDDPEAYKKWLSEKAEDGTALTEAEFAELVLEAKGKKKDTEATTDPDDDEASEFNPFPSIADMSSKELANELEEVSKPGWGGSIDYKEAIQDAAFEAGIELETDPVHEAALDALDDLGVEYDEDTIDDAIAESIDRGNTDPAEIAQDVADVLNLDSKPGADPESDREDKFWAVQDALKERGYDDAESEDYDDAINEAIDSLVETDDPGEIADQVVRYLESGGLPDGSRFDDDVEGKPDGPESQLGREREGFWTGFTSPGGWFDHVSDANRAELREVFDRLTADQEGLLSLTSNPEWVIVRDRVQDQTSRDRFGGKEDYWRGFSGGNHWSTEEAEKIRAEYDAGWEASGPNAALRRAAKARDSLRDDRLGNMQVEGKPGEEGVVPVDDEGMLDFDSPEYLEYEDQVLSAAESTYGVNRDDLLAELGDGDDIRQGFIDGTDPNTLASGMVAEMEPDEAGDGDEDEGGPDPTSAQAFGLSTPTPEQQAFRDFLQGVFEEAGFSPAESGDSLWMPGENWVDQDDGERYSGAEIIDLISDDETWDEDLYQRLRKKALDSAGGLTSAARYVRTPEGEDRYNQPIGTRIFAKPRIRGTLSNKIEGHSLDSPMKRAQRGAAADLTPEDLKPSWIPGLNLSPLEHYDALVALLTQKWDDADADRKANIEQILSRVTPPVDYTEAGAAWTSALSAELINLDEIEEHSPLMMAPSIWPYIYEDGTLHPTRARIYKRAIANAFKGKRPVGEGGLKRYVMMGGGPAGGKTTTLAKMPKYQGFKDAAVEINPDDLKEKLPEYNQMLGDNDESAAGHVHEESSFLAKKIRADALARGYNVLYDAVNAKGKTPGEIRALKEAGYQVDWVGVTVPPQVAIERAHLRGIREGRFVDPELVAQGHQMTARFFDAIAQAADTSVLTESTTGKQIAFDGTIVDNDAYDTFRKREAPFEVNEARMQMLQDAYDAEKPDPEDWGGNLGGWWQDYQRRMALREIDNPGTLDSWGSRNFEHQWWRDVLANALAQAGRSDVTSESMSKPATQEWLRALFSSVRFETLV